MIAQFHGHQQAQRPRPSARVALADMVGVDGPGGQPAQPLVDDLERFDVDGRGLQHERGLAERERHEKRDAFSDLSLAVNGGR